MRTFLLTTILGLSSQLFSQINLPNVMFVFQNTTVFTEQFENKEDAKNFNFEITGLTNAADAQALSHFVSTMRGVESFQIEPSSQNDTYNAKLTVYKYASGFWYWKTFMEKTGVSKFKIDSKVYTSENIINVE